MTLLDRLKELLDLTDADITKKEANLKFLSTLMFVNEELVKIMEFNYTLNTILIERSGGLFLVPLQSQLNSLKPFLPLTGLYPSADGRALFITKKPIKHWYKGYHTSFYSCKTIGNIGKEKELSIFDVCKSKCVEIFVDKQKQIWYLDIIIGYVDTSTSIICTDFRFVQELLDWTKHDTITIK